MAVDTKRTASFTEFCDEAEPRLRRALCVAFGRELGLDVRFDGEAESIARSAILRGTIDTQPADALRLQAVTGLVQDLERRPVAGATVRLVPDPRQQPLPGSRSQPLPPVRSTADGAFRFPRVPPGEGYRLTVEAKGRAPWTSNAFAVDRGGTTVLDPVRLAPGWRVRLAVRDLDGEPLADVDVRARAVTRPVSAQGGPWQGMERRGRTDAAGEVLLEDLPLDDVLLEARASGEQYE